MGSRTSTWSGSLCGPLPCGCEQKQCFPVRKENLHMICVFVQIYFTSTFAYRGLNHWNKRRFAHATVNHCPPRNWSQFQRFFSSLCEGMESIWSDEFCRFFAANGTFIYQGFLSPPCFIALWYQHYINTISPLNPIKSHWNTTVNRIYKSWRSVHRKKKTVFHCHGLMAGLRSHRGLSDSGMSQMRWDSCARAYLVLGGGHIPRICKWWVPLNHPLLDFSFINQPFRGIPYLWTPPYIPW